MLLHFYLTPTSSTYISNQKVFRHHTQHPIKQQTQSIKLKSIQNIILLLIFENGYNYSCACDL